MSEVQKEISELEENAKTLVNNLNELRKQAGSYNNAKDELEKTNTHLITLIETTQKLAEETHRVVQVINEIGSGKIFIILKRQQNILLIGFMIIVILEIIQLIKFI